MFAFSFFASNCAFAYEFVQASTEIPKKDKTTVNYVDDQKPIQGSVLEDSKFPDRKEFAIPNIFDAMLIKRIEETNAAEAAAQKTNPAPAKKEITIDSKELEYFDDTGELEAAGNVVINSGPDNTVTSDRAVYDKNSNIIKLFGNVILRRGENVASGEYMVIDLNEENALMDAPTIAVGPLIRIRAQEAYAYTDRFEAVNGSVELAKKIEMCLKSSRFNSYDKMLIQDEDVSFDLKKERLSSYKIKAKEIIIEPKKDHDSLILKNADLYYKKLKVVTLGSLELFSDKEMNYTEVNVPIDVGSLDDFGTYFGMGYIFKLPTGASLKVSPALVYDHEIGIGVLGSLKTKRLTLDAAWATSSENLILDGEYKIIGPLRAEFGRHAYKDEWFLGSNRAGHIAQLVYDDSYRVKDLDANFRHRITAGYASDYVAKHQEDNNDGTMRLRGQSELSKNLFKVSNKEQDMSLEMGIFGQTAATVYGTGETTALVRGGPWIHSRVKNWKSNIAYAFGGFHGKSPFEFDEYTYGKSSFSIDESLMLTKHLSIGYRGTISPLKDNSDNDLFTENRFYVIAGPDDIKVAFSYDTIRENAYLDFMFLLGTDNTGITYEKLTIKDPDKLRKKEPGFMKDWQYRKIKVPENL